MLLDRLFRLTYYRILPLLIERALPASFLQPEKISSRHQVKEAFTHHGLAIEKIIERQNFTDGSSLWFGKLLCEGQQHRLTKFVVDAEGKFSEFRHERAGHKPIEEQRKGVVTRLQGICKDIISDYNKLNPDDKFKHSITLHYQQSGRKISITRTNSAKGLYWVEEQQAARQGTEKEIFSFLYKDGVISTEYTSANEKTVIHNEASWADKLKAASVIQKFYSLTAQQVTQIS